MREFVTAYRRRLALAGCDEAELNDRLQTGSDFVHDAFEVARRAHAPQRRADGTPYITHPIEVARIAAGVMPDPLVIASCLLHDTVEDCDVTNQDLATRFGSNLAEIVEGVTKLDKAAYADKESAAVANYERLFQRGSENFPVIVVKLADRLHNMRTLGATAAEKQNRIATETRDIFVGLARRVGMTQIADELEDLTRAVQSASEWSRVRGLVELVLQQQRGALEEFLRSLEEMLEALQISGRAIQMRRPIGAVLESMRNAGRDEPLGEDVVWYALVVDDGAPFNELIGGLADRWQPLPGYRNYLQQRSDAGLRYVEQPVLDDALYRVVVRIWPRSGWQEAGGGLANYWNYRTGALADEYAEIAALRLRALADSSATLAQAGTTRERYEEFRDALRALPIRVYTPKQHPVELQSGATALDFAFAVHSGLGFHARSARINGMEVALRTKLHSGDVITIERAEQPVADPARIGWVRTSAARMHLRRWFLQHDQDRLRRFGQAMLDAELQSFGIEASELFADGGRARRLKGEGWDSVHVIAEAIATHRVDAKKISSIAFMRRRGNRPTENVVCVPDTVDEGPTVRIARCCMPVPGVEARAFVDNDTRLVVHRASCVTLEMFARRLGAPMNYPWPDAPDGQPRLFRARFAVYTEDRPRMLSRLTEAISSMGANIIKATCESRVSGPAVNLFELDVESQEQVDAIHDRLSRLPGVQELWPELLMVPRTAAGSGDAR